jgi:hypothetical protein
LETELYQEEYSCPEGVQKPHLEYIRSLWGVQENVDMEDDGSWFSSKRDPAVVQLRIPLKNLKGMCQNKMKRDHVYGFSSLYSDTLPLILLFYAAFY